MKESRQGFVPVAWDLLIPYGIGFWCGISAGWNYHQLPMGVHVLATAYWITTICIRFILHDVNKWTKVSYQRTTRKMYLYYGITFQLRNDKCLYTTDWTVLNIWSHANITKKLKMISTVMMNVYTQLLNYRNCKMRWELSNKSNIWSRYITNLKIYLIINITKCPTVV